MKFRANNRVLRAPANIRPALSLTAQAFALLKNQHVKAHFAHFARNLQAGHACERGQGGRWGGDTFKRLLITVRALSAVPLRYLRPVSPT